MPVPCCSDLRKALLLSFASCYLPQIIAGIILVSLFWVSSNQHHVFIWIFVYICVLFVILLANSLLFFFDCPPTFPASAIWKSFQRLLDLFLLAWFIVGIVWLSQSAENPALDPHIFRAGIAFVTLSILSCCLPCGFVIVLICSFCCCLDQVLDYLEHRRSLVHDRLFGLQPEEIEMLTTIVIFDDTAPLFVPSASPGSSSSPSRASLDSTLCAICLEGTPLIFFSFSCFASCFNAFDSQNISLDSEFEHFHVFQPIIFTHLVSIGPLLTFRPSFLIFLSLFSYSCIQLA